MDKATYQKSVLATLDKKTVKVGLQQASKHPQWSPLLQALVGLSTETGALVGVTRGYLSGATQFTDALKDAAREEMADISFYLVAAAKQVKKSLPSSTKKAKFVGTRTEAVLKFSAGVADALAVAQLIFAVAPTKLVKKTVTIPTKDANGTTTGADKVEKELPVVDAAALKDAVNKALAELATHIEGLIADYWVVHAALFDEAPAATFALGRKNLEANYPAGFFDKFDPKPKAEKPNADAPAVKAAPAKKVAVKKAVKQLAEPDAKA